MSTDWAKKKKPLRERLLDLLLDLKWHPNTELGNIGGNRYAARILELRRLGYEIETQGLRGDGGKMYRLVSSTRGKTKPKRVKVYLEEADVASMVSGGGISQPAHAALSDALSSFRVNASKL